MRLNSSGFNHEKTRINTKMEPYKWEPKKAQKTITYASFESGKSMKSSRITLIHMFLIFVMSNIKCSFKF